MQIMIEDNEPRAVQISLIELMPDVGQLCGNDGSVNLYQLLTFVERHISLWQTCVAVAAPDDRVHGERMVMLLKTVQATLTRRVIAGFTRLHAAEMDARVCPNCSALNREVARFCRCCGNPLNMPAAMITTPLDNGQLAEKEAGTYANHFSGGLLGCHATRQP